MPQINQLNTLDNPNDSDLLPIYSQQNGDARKVSVGNLRKAIESGNAQTEGFVTQYSFPAGSGFTTLVVSSKAHIWLILRPTAPFNAGTIKLPPQSDLFDGQRLVVNMTEEILNLTIDGNGANLSGQPITLAKDGSFELRYDAGSNIWYRVSGTDSSALAVTYQPAGADAVATTVQAKLRESVSVKDFGAVGDGVADDTAAIQSAVDTVGAAGGGSVYFPPGTYLVGNGNPGASNWDNKVAIWVLYSNVRLIGAGAGATKILLKANANAHVIKFGQREGGTVTVSHGGVYDMEIDGNRANQVTPTATADHQQGIDVVSGCASIILERLHIHDCIYYGIGFQRDNIHNCVVRDVVIDSTGADAIDWKDDSDSGTGNIIEHLKVSNFGLVSGLLSGQAGVDLRSGVFASKIVVSNPGILGTIGIRIQNGSAGAIPVQPTRVTNFSVIGNNAANSVGVRVISRDSSVSEGKAVRWADGFSLSDPDLRFSNLYASTNNVGFRLWQNIGAGAEANTALLQGIIARSNGQAGIVYDAVNEITVIGADVRSNAIGHDIRADASYIKIIGGSCTGNTTPITNSGANIVIANVNGFRTYSTVVGVAAIDSTGLKTVTIPHTLAVTPSTKDVSVTLRRNTNVGDWACGFYNVVSCDATNVVIQLRVTAASATAGAVVDVIATVNALATM